MPEEARGRIVLALALMGGIVGLDARARAQPAPEADEPDAPVVSKQELFADREAMTAGTNVRLDDMVIRAKSGNVLRVGHRRHEIFVVPENPSTLQFLAVGAHIDIQGTLRQAPSASQARLIYVMGAREARRLARSKLYVDAWVVTAID